MPPGTPEEEERLSARRADHNQQHKGTQRTSKAGIDRRADEDQTDAIGQEGVPVVVTCPADITAATSPAHRKR